MREAFWFGAGRPANGIDWSWTFGYARQPFASFAAGAWQARASSTGVILGVFGWIDPSSGEVSNAQSTGSLLVFVLATMGMYDVQRVYSLPAYPDVPQWEGMFPLIPQSSITDFPPFPIAVLRAGCECVCAVSGVFRTRFPLGGNAGDSVWADPATGLAYSADGGSYVKTSWILAESVAPNCAATISSFLPALSQ